MNKRDFKNNALDKLTENKSESAQICNLPTTPFQKTNKNNATVNCPDKLRVQFNSQSAY